MRGEAVADEVQHTMYERQRLPRARRCEYDQRAQRCVRCSFPLLLVEPSRDGGATGDLGGVVGEGA